MNDTLDDRGPGCALVSQNDLAAAIGGPALLMTSTSSHDGADLYECVISTEAGGLIVDLLDKGDWQMYGNGSRLGDTPEGNTDATVSTAHGSRVVTDLPGGYHLALRSEHGISREMDTAVSDRIVHNLALTRGLVPGLPA